MDFAPVWALANFKTQKQIQVVHEAYNILISEEHTLSSLNRKINKKTSISEPTIRRVLEKLRKEKLIVAGSRGNENIKVSFNRGYSREVMHSAPVTSNLLVACKSDRERGVRFPLTPSCFLNEKRVNGVD